MTASPRTKWIPSSKSKPCSMCGRDVDGDCRISQDGQHLICHYGTRFAPPSGLKPGDVQSRADGVEWAFTHNNDRGAHFTIHKPLSTERSSKSASKVVPFQRPAAPLPINVPIELASMPAPWPAPPPAHLPDGHRIDYSPTQWTEWRDRPGKDGSKERGERPRHLDGSCTVYKAGPEPWPLFGSHLIAAAAGKWIAAAEGPKCAMWLQAGGVVAVSQPGHDHSSESIIRRLRELVAAGVAGMVYLADHDDTGRKKAEQLQQCTAEAGLRLLVLHAADLWPGLPAGGSIDDAPGTAAERVAAITAAVVALVAKLQEPAKGFRSAIEVMGLEEAESELREAINDGITPSQLTQLVASLATLTRHNAGTIEKIAASIRREEDSTSRIEAEAQAIATQADRRQLAGLLTPAHLLPAPIAQAIVASSRYLPTDGPSAVVPFLSAVASLVGLGTEVVGSTVANLRVPINLYSCLVARSGAKKSPIGKQLMILPIAALVGEQEAANQAAWQAWREACEQAKADKKPTPAEPVPLRLVVSEYSGEALNVQLQALEKAGQGLLIHRDELAGLFGSLNQYRGGKGSDEQQLLELYDGAGFTSLRIASHRSYSRAQVSIYGTTQPDVLRELVAEGDASGLWARFIFVPLPERVVQLPLKTTAAEVAEVESAAQMLADVCRTVRGMRAASYHLSEEATERFARFEARRQQEALRATISAQSALLGKSAGKVLRIAGLLHLLRVAVMEADKDEPIDAELIDKAAGLVDHLDGWALSLHAEVNQGPATGLMRLVHRVAEETDAPIRWKDVQNRLSRKDRQETDAAAGAAAMQALADGGYGEIEAGQRGSISYRALRPLP